MATIVVHTQGTLITARSRHLVLEPPGGDKVEQPVLAVDRLHLYGRIQVATTAISLLARHGREVAWFTRRGRLLARLAGDPAHGVDLRRAQYRLADDPPATLAIARRLVAAKILNQRAVLLRSWRGRNQIADQDCLDALEAAAVKVLDAPDPDLLRGLEGAAAARYFQAWAALMPQFPWDGRNRRPPRDPLNVLLSFGYTLLTNECQSQAEARGFDVWMGVLHGLRPGRAALALDLVEPLRPVVIDRLILDLVTHHRLGPEHFATDQPDDEDDQDADPEHPHPVGPLPRLSPEGFRRYLAAYERRMAHRAPDADSDGGLRAQLESQVGELAHALRQGTAPAWQPWRLRT